MKKYSSILIMFLVALFSSFETLASGSIKLSVDYPRGQNVICVGDLFYINIEAENINTPIQKPSNVPGCKVNYFVQSGQSTYMHIVNGKTTRGSIISYVVTLKAEQEGTFSFGPIDVAGVKSNKITYKIEPAGTVKKQQPQQPAQGTQPQLVNKGGTELILKATLSKTKVYEQEALLYTVKLYTTYEGVFSNITTSNPDFKDFVVEKSDDKDREFSLETLNGKTYKTAVIDRFVVFPQKSGTLSIGGNTYTLTLEKRDVYNDPFFGPMYHSVPVQIEAVPNDVSVEVMQLPQPQPHNFSGAVGQFSISSTFPSKQLVENQVATVIYKVTGKGNVKYLHLPDLSEIYPSEFKVYSSTSNSDCRVIGRNVEGENTFENVIMPLESGNYEIPDLEFVYFNPITQTYETVRANGCDVTVADNNIAGEVKKGSVEQNLNTRLQTIGELQTERLLIIKTMTYWMWFIIPTLLLLISIAIYRKRHRDAENIGIIRQKKAGKVAQRRLKKAYNCMKKQNHTMFYDEMLSAIWGYLSDKLSIATSELNRDNIKNVLEQHGVSIADSEKLIALLDNCEFAKYASSMSYSENMFSVYQQGVEVIESLDNSIKK